MVGGGEHRVQSASLTKLYKAVTKNNVNNNILIIWRKLSIPRARRGSGESFPKCTSLCFSVCIRVCACARVCECVHDIQFGRVFLTDYLKPTNRLTTPNLSLNTVRPRERVPAAAQGADGGCDPRPSQPFTSTFHTSNFTFHTSHFTCQISHCTLHISLVNTLNKQPTFQSIWKPEEIVPEIFMFPKKTAHDQAARSQPFETLDLGIPMKMSKVADAEYYLSIIDDFSGHMNITSHW